MEKHHRTIYNLPEEMIAEILKRLQVKYLLRCKCVQKSWYYLIQTPAFISLHLNHQNLTTHKYLFFKNVYTRKLTVRSDDVQCREYCKLIYPPGLPEYPWYAQSYGLVCVSPMFNFHLEYNPIIHLWNPLVGKYKTLPDSPLPRCTSKETRWRAIAFGYVPKLNDYVVVHIVNNRLVSEQDTGSVMIGVYNLSTNSWRKIIQDNVFILLIINTDVVFVNGAAYWLGLDQRTYGIVMCFDTKNDILRVISLPAVGNHPSILHPFGQSVAYFVEDNRSNAFEMWVLKDNLIDESSWEKKIRVSLRENARVKILGTRNNGDPILSELYNLISYNLHNHEPSIFVDSWNLWADFPNYDSDDNDYENDPGPPFFIRPFVESLVLLNI